jgi:hypothetical protein
MPLIAIAAWSRPSSMFCLSVAPLANPGLVRSLVLLVASHVELFAVAGLM